MPTAVDSTVIGIIAAIVGIVAALVARRWAGGDARDAAIRRVAREYREALARGDAEGAALAKRRYDYLKAGGTILMLLCLCLAAGGCRTRPQPPLVLSEHVRFMAGGETVPPLPQGQKHWLLLTVPTGVAAMLPTDFPMDGDSK